MNRPEGVAERHESGFDPRALEQLRVAMHEPFDSYQALRARLEKSGQLEAAEEYVERLYAQNLSDAPFLTKQDWDMLTAIWIYDPETMDHSIETYHIARERIDRPLELKEHSVVINLSQEFSREGVQRDQFLRACLLHDVGKIAVPVEILTNHTSDTECAHILFAHYDSLGTAVREALAYTPEQPLPDSPEALLRALQGVSVRPQRLVPVRYMLSSETEQAAVAAGLTRLGLTLDDSLLTIMRTHDRYSRSILSEESLPIEAELAGAHHRHEKEYSPTQHTITIGTLQVSVDLADIIHLADVTQAMKSRRHYKESQSELVVLATLVEHADHGLVDPFITYLWIADEWYRVRRPVDSADVHFRAINRFLESGKQAYGPTLEAYQAAQ